MSELSGHSFYAVKSRNLLQSLASLVTFERTK